MGKQMKTARIPKFSATDALTGILMEHGMSVHPDADMFPKMSENGIKELAADIKAHGLREAITAKGKEIWDGRHRLIACALADVKPQFVPPPKGVTASQFIIGKNILRRHLTTNQRRDLAAKLLKMNPEKSDRAVAEQVKLSPPTVAKIRKEEEGRENILHVEKHTDSKGRKQPASKPKASRGKPTLEELADALRKPKVAASPEISADERRAKMAALDTAEKIRQTKDPVAEFKHACRHWLEQMNPEQKKEAIAFFYEFLKLVPQQLVPQEQLH